MERALETAEEELEDRFERFFRAYYHSAILEAVHGYPETRSIVVDFEVLDRYDIQLADLVINSPDSAIPAAQRACSRIEQPVGRARAKLNVRFTNLPSTSKLAIRDIRSENVGKLISIEGIVRKATDVRPKLVVAAFECRKCGEMNLINQRDESLREPYLCQGCENRGPFKLDVESSQFVDSQKILVQENLEDLRGGEHPKQIVVLLEDDLTGRLTPGDSVEVIGVLRAGLKKSGGTKSRVVEIFIEANNFNPVEIEFEEVQISKEDERKIVELAKDPEIYSKIVRSIAPHIYGYEEIKEAIMYQLFSAPAIELPDGGRIRGDSHIIIMGEPATGKSEILQYVAKELAPRGVYASGKGTSGAGLTAAAVKDEFGDGGWSLEAGALVLADRGIACIDEFDKMEPGDRSAMHEAMEQQSVSIAKAGILATFRSRCAILAAANPKYGRFDEYRPISEQVNLPPTILSRFDLIFFVRDDLSKTRDVARHILDTASSPDSLQPPIPPELLRKYIAYARQNIFPELSQEARRVIEDFYVEMREVAQQSEDVPIPLTARQLWAIVRLARARARVRLSRVVTAEDAERAIELIKFSLSQAGLDFETGKVDIDKIYVGVTKSQRDKIREILGIIRELEEEYGTAKRSEILEEAERRGISKGEVDEILKKLHDSGDIFEPKHDHFKTA
ncbi:MAG: minichromosome maintenance protein MCM [Euryarchaeota archaeon]|nr:minichromosome maintenance protein MCM [Euryarchaeota archaeon]